MRTTHLVISITSQCEKGAGFRCSLMSIIHRTVTRGKELVRGTIAATCHTNSGRLFTVTSRGFLGLVLLRSRLLNAHARFQLKE